MIDLAEIERLPFPSSDSLTRLDSLLGEVAGYAETRTAFEIVGILEGKSRGTPALSSALDPYIVKFGTLALPLLPEQHVVTIMQHLTRVVTDERISLYERLRARLLVLPESQRSTFAQSLLTLMRGSTEPLETGSVNISGKSVAPTVGAWVTAFEAAQGPKKPDAFFMLPELKGLEGTARQTVRHVLHVVALLADPSSSAPSIANVVEKQAPQAPPVNLPVAPAVVPELKKTTPLVAAVSPPANPPTASPSTPEQVSDRGPTVASVLAKLRQTQLDTIVAPPTVAHLTPDDEAEIKQHADTLASIDAGPNVHDTVADTVSRIATESGVSFPDEHLAKRFSSIVTARLKDIRSPSETLDLLTRGIKVGGLELDPEVAEKVVTKANDEAVKFTTEEGVQTLIKRQQATPTLPKPPKVPPPPVVSAPVAPPKEPVRSGPRPPVRQPIPPLKVPVQEIRRGPAVVPSMPTASFRPAVAERPTMSDIRGTSRLVGPVEELRSITLADYRRLAPDAVGCIRRVYEKIQQLGKESFSRRAEGIRAWRESETYRVYVAMGQESLVTTKPINDVIFQRQQRGEPVLTEQEFSYVADLNRKLRV